MKINLNNLNNLKLELYPLPFNKEHVIPFMSEETLTYHFNKHHKAYVDKSLSLLNTVDELSLVNLLKIHKTYEESLLYFNLAQVFNHHLFWLSIENKPTSEEEKIFLSKHFGSYENFINEFINAGLKRFGSGWIWLLEINNQVKIIPSSNGVIPEEVFENANIISVCDVWEHAYYIDYRHDRKQYLEIFVNNLIKLNI
jgi:Fe-Mn family superoxide dismutase